jgi:hypothetical protein
MGVRVAVISVGIFILGVGIFLLWRASGPQWEPPAATDAVWKVRVNGIDLEPSLVDAELAMLFQELGKTKIQRWGNSGAGRERVFIYYQDRELRLNLIDDSKIEASIKSRDYRTKVFIRNPKVAQALMALIMSGQEATETQP